MSRLINILQKYLIVTSYKATDHAAILFGLGNANHTVEKEKNT